MKKHIVVLTGAGISAESGIPTFRDANGLWEGHDVLQVATPEGFAKNPELVLQFYNQRRKQLAQVKPNQAHYDLAALEKKYKVSIITQNVDDLHERAGSNSVLHLHGELKKVRSTKNENLIIDWETDVQIGDVATDGSQLRPHIVWFGEAVTLLDTAISICSTATVLFIIGTSLQVYPAASLVQYVPTNTPIFLIDPNPAFCNMKNLTIIEKQATLGVADAINRLAL